MSFTISSAVVPLSVTDHQILSLQEVLAFDQEEFLFQSRVHVHALMLELSDRFEQLEAFARQCRFGSQQRNLLVQRFASP